MRHLYIINRSRRSIITSYSSYIDDVSAAQTQIDASLEAMDDVQYALYCIGIRNALLGQLFRTKSKAKLVRKTVFDHAKDLMIVNK